LNAQPVVEQTPPPAGDDGPARPDPRRSGATVGAFQRRSKQHRRDAATPEETAKTADARDAAADSGTAGHSTSSTTGDVEPEGTTPSTGEAE
jgi:hypothetical protein